MADYGKVGEAFLELRADLSKLQGDLSRVQAQIGPQVDKLGKDVQGRLGKAFGGLAEPANAAASAIASIGAGAVFGKLISTASEFQAKMKDVAGVSGATAEQLKALSDQAVSLGGTTSASAGEAADAMKELAAAGFSVQETMTAVPGVLSLAAAAQVSVGRSAEVAAGILRQYGLAAGEVGRVNDVLIGTANRSATDLNDLANSFKFTGTIASQLGISLEDTAGALGVLGNNAVKGEQAGTSLRGIFSSLVNPSKTARDAMAELGLTVADLDPKTKGLAGAFQALADKGATTADFFAIFGQEGATSASILAQNASAVGALGVELTKTTGEAAKLAALKTDGAKGALEQLSGAVESLAIKVANSGILDAFTSIVKVGADLVQRVGDLDPKILAFGGTLTAFAAVVTPLAATFGVLVLALGAVSAPVLAVAAAVGVAAAAFVAFYDEITGFIANPVEGLKSAIAGISAALGSLGDTLAGYKAQLLAALPGFITDMVTAVQGAAPALLAAAGSLGSALLTGAQGVISGLLNSYATGFQQIGTVVTGALNQLKGLIGPVLGEVAVSAIDAAQRFVTGVTDRIASGLRSLAGIARDAMGGFRDAVRNGFSGLADFAIEQMVRMVDGIRDALGAKLASAFDAVAAPVEQAKALFADLYDAVVGNSYIPDLVDETGQHMRRLDAELVAPTAAATGEAGKAFAQLQKDANKSLAGIKPVPRPAFGGNVPVPVAKPVPPTSVPTARSPSISTSCTSSVQMQPLDPKVAESYAEIGERMASNNRVVGAFAQNTTDLLVNAAETGKFAFKDFAESLIKDLQRIAIEQAVLSAIGLAFGGAGAQVGATAGAGVRGGTRSAKGNVFGPEGLMRFAKGGAFTNQIIRKPTTFRMAKGMGLMGEAGPEAVMPLTRTASGKLGVQAEGGGGGGGQTSIVINDQRGASAPQIETRETMGPGGSRQIEVFVQREVQRSLGTGKADRVMGQRYGLKPQPR